MRSLGRPLFDPTVYPTEEKVGEDLLQRWMMELLRPMLQRVLSERGEVACVGADQFMYWKQFDPRTTIAPDIYVLPGVPEGTRVTSWKTWETGIVPSFCLEIVGYRDPEEDYREAPERYDALGVEELVVYDPEPRGAERITWQVYRRHARRGLVLVERSDGDRVRARTIRCWLRVVGEGDERRLRIGLGARGDELVPTPEEALAAARAENEALRRVAATRRRKSRR